MAYKNLETRRVYIRKRYRDKKEEITAQNRVWRKNNRARLYDKDTPEGFARLKKERERSRRLHRALKLEVLTHYSPNACLGCCWPGCCVVDIDMLTLDHINDDGAEHRRKIKSNHIYYAVKNDGFPDKFQTLCSNHQLKKEAIRRAGEESR